jgi:hypothetical protein
MKKLTLILTIILFSLTGFAKNWTGNYYMVSTGETMSCKKITLGRDFTKATLENGTKVTIPTAEIKLYRLNGKIFEKLPVFVNNKATGRQQFMEFVTTRGGLNLYRYSKYEEGIDKSTGAYLGVSKVDYYCVFRGDQYWVAVTDRNYQTLFDFFRIKYN